MSTLMFGDATRMGKNPLVISASCVVAWITLFALSGTSIATGDVVEVVSTRVGQANPTKLHITWSPESAHQVNG